MPQQPSFSNEHGLQNKKAMKQKEERNLTLNSIGFVIKTILRKKLVRRNRIIVLLLNCRKKRKVWNFSKDSSGLLQKQNVCSNWNCTMVVFTILFHFVFEELSYGSICPFKYFCTFLSSAFESPCGLDIWPCPLLFVPLKLSLQPLEQSKSSSEWKSFL